MRKTLNPIAVLLSAALVVAACGGDDDATDATDTTTDVVTETDPPAEPEAETFAITAVDYAFEGVPETIPSGAQLTLSNASEAEVHEVVAIRVPDDEDRSAAELLQLPEEELDAAIPEDEPPATVIVAPPGEEGFAVLGDGSLTEPGRYILLCAIPVGADPEEFLSAEGEGPPDVEGGPPHFVEGMFAEITVE